LGVPQHLAQWLNLIAFLPMAAVSLVVHAKHKLLDKRGFWTLIVPSMVTATVCALLAVKTSARVLAVIFACFLTLMGLSGSVMTIAKTIKEKRRDIPHEPPL
jgi:hypothetical protein